MVKDQFNFTLKLGEARTYEKVYDISGTLPQHLVGVFKPNKKLTSTLKETHQHTKSFNLKRQN